MKVFKHIASFRQEAQLGTWITRIMINTALNKQRQRINMLPLVETDHEQWQETHRDMPEHR